MSNANYVVKKPAKDLKNHFSKEILSRQPSPLKEIFHYTLDKSFISLGGGLPLPDYFPFEEISAKVVSSSGDNDSLSSFGISKYNKEQEVNNNKNKNEVIDIDLAHSLQYGHSAGNPILNNYLKDHTEIIHHPPYEDWTVVQTIGSTQGLDSLLRGFTNPGDFVLTEEFSFSSALETIRGMGRNVLPVKMDLEGILPNSLEEILSNWPNDGVKGKRPSVFYIIPTGQNPTGSTLSSERRKKIYDIACKYDILILEDEPYYFLQMEPYDPLNASINPKVPKDILENNNRHKEFLSKLVPSFLSIDTEGRVLRLDSFSKVIAPGSRVGWITCQNVFAERLIRQHEVTIQTPSGFSQSLLNGLLERWGQYGYIDWLLHLRFEYTARRNVALSAMDKYLNKDIVDFIAPTAGMFFWVKIKAEKHPKFLELGPIGVENEILDKCIDNKLVIVPGKWFDASSFSTSNKNEITKGNINESGVYFRGNFASVDFDILRQGIKVFGQVLSEEFK